MHAVWDSLRVATGALQDMSARKLEPQKAVQSEEQARQLRLHLQLACAGVAGLAQLGWLSTLAALLLLTWSGWEICR